MTDRAGLLAGAAEVFTAQCVYYIVAATMIIGRQGWGLALLWPLLCAAAAAAVFRLALKKPRSTTFLTVLTGALFALFLAVFLLASDTPLTVLYGAVLAVFAGLTAGMPLYKLFHRPTVHQHLTDLDVLLLAFLWLLLTQSGAQGGTEGRGLVGAVLLLDVGAAVGLRMSDGGQNAGALRAGLVALGAAGAMALIVMALTGLFSRSAGVTGAVLSAAGAFFSRLGALLTAFFTWFASLFPAPEGGEEVTIDEGVAGIPSTAVDQAEASSYNGTWIAVALAALILAAVVLLAFRFRRKRFSAAAHTVSPVAAPAVSRMSGAMKKRWLALLAALRFALDAFVRRDTPEGVLAWLERRARRKKEPRRPGESMRAFVTRMDASGRLSPLADALDRRVYGGGAGLPAGECRTLRRLARS